MDMLDVFYRALVDYRKNTKENRDFANLRSTIKSSNTNNDLIEITRHIFTVEEDWIIAIEEGLVHIERALAEERQFIRSNGEVVPIEKAKRVSKDSVSHLARHSNLITKKVDEKNLIPDQIYTVEKLSDYSVYENRFLYMLLCYLRDFISLRYDKILELSNTYKGTMEMKKTISSRNQKISFEVKLKEEKKNDKFLKEHNQAKSIIDRIDLLLKTVLVYLSTPLMEEVGKTAMLKPPITKTNVLKMNKNFKGAVALYEYVSSYDKVGYSIEVQTKKISPFIDDVGDEFSEVIALTSFLTYEHGNGISKELKANYEKEEEYRKQQESIKFQEQLNSLRKRIKTSGLTMEEYMLMLEKRNKALEKDSAQLILANQEIERLNKEINKLNNHIDSLGEQISGLDKTILTKDEEIAALKQKYIDDINALKVEHEKEIADLNEQHINEINLLNEQHAMQIEELKTSYEEQIAEIKASYEERIETLISEHKNEIEELNNRHNEEIMLLNSKHENEIKELNDRYDTLKLDFENKQTELQNVNDKLAEQEKVNEELVIKNDETKQILTDEKTLLLAQINALRATNGKNPLGDEFTSKEKFDELEKEFDTFKKVFKKQWQATRKRIYKEVEKENKYVKTKKDK